MKQPPSSATLPTPDEPATASADSLQKVIATNMSKTAVQHAIRDPRFVPGARQAFFSTELGTRPPRQLDLEFKPAVARSFHDPAAVVQAARYWQVKYKNQCLCILPNQGWIADDLWDAVDIHVEGRKFCDQMLTFIGRDTWYTAHRFAKDWARAHYQQFDFTGIQIGDVYDPKDPLSALDQIFVFGELTSFPRPFLWHVAFILIANWNDARWASAPALNACRDQYLPVVSQQGDSEIKGSSAKISKSNGKEAAPSPEATDRTDSVVRPDPDQPTLQPPPQRIMPHVSQLPNDLQAHTRHTGAERMAGPSTASPNMRMQGLKVHKDSRNLVSPPGIQSKEWIENESRTVSGLHLGQPPVQGPGVQQSQYIPHPIAMGPHMHAPMIPGSAMSSYVLGPPMLTHPVYPAQPLEPAMISRGHMNYHTGPTRGSHMPPAYVNQSKETQSISMGDTTNIHFPGFMRPQLVDPLAPMPRRLSQQSSNQLFDPYNGTSRKFSGVQGHNDMGKKSGTGNFTALQNRGRRSSTSSSSHQAYGSYYYVPPTGSRYAETNSRWRSSEDDTSITGDSVFGCGHTWIGPKNTTVKELWIGDLPLDVRESELKQLFEKTVGITPLSISIRSNASKGHVHAFAAFTSPADARAALTVNQFNPRLRNGEVRPAISVPKRLYQKESPPTAFSEYSRVVHAAGGYVRGAANAPLGEKSTATSTDSGTATTSGTVLYSPQDARSGLLKKPQTVQLEATNLTESKTSEVEKPKHQITSPSKKAKSKNKRDSPIKKGCRAADVPSRSEKLEMDVLPAPAVRDSKSNTVAHTDVQNAHSTKVQSDSSNAVQDICHATDEREGAIAQSLEQSAQLKSPQSKDEVARSKSPPTHLEVVPENTPLQALQHDETTTSPAEAGKEAEDDTSDDGAKNDNSFYSAPEVQTEATQMEPEAKAEDQATDVNHGTVFPTSKMHDNPLQDSPNPLVPAGGLNNDTSRSVPSSTENSSESEPRKNCGRDKETDAYTAHTEASPVKQFAMMSTSIKGASADAVKKCGVQQIQSLHPFATKSKAQAKKEKETRRKQQKKEEADRIAKAKAGKVEKVDKVAPSKKVKSGTDTELRTEMLPTLDASSVATGIPSGLDTATTNTEKHAIEETKKSKGKSKAKVAIAKEEDKRTSGSEKDKIDKPPASALTVTTSVPQKADKIKDTKTSTVVQGPSTRTETQLETSLSTPSSLAAPTPTTSKTDHTQPSTVIRCPTLSRHSSISTIAGDTGEPTGTSTPINNPGTFGPPEETCTGAPVNQSDNTPTETPKKKKNKRKNKKKKVPVEPSMTIEPIVYGNAPARIRRSAMEDTHNYDPFTSQMTHIDAIRYNVEHDTTSYFAVTNAAREQERLQREPQERKATDVLPQSGNEE